jgi:penicillin-binding protein 1A
MARKPKSPLLPKRPSGQPPAAAHRFRAFVKWAVILGLWGSVAVAALVGWYAWDLPGIEKLQTQTRRPGVTLLAADGSVLASRGEIHAAPVRYADVPRFLVQAVVATEDRRFFDHMGVDAIGVLRAAMANLRAGALRQGGSTLTQQLAKNLFLTPARTLRRKVQEALLAFWLEARFTKRQLFTIYLNRVYLGAATYGFEAASRRYFGKSVRRVNLHEAAMLAGLLKAPSRYSPARSPAAARARAAQVLANMVDAGFISRAASRKAAGRKLRFRRAAARARANYFTDWVLDRAAGFVGQADRDLVIHTTLDATLQRLAETELRRILAGPGKRAGVTQGALVALAPDGAVRAMVGGRSYAASKFNRATQARRQPGSAFKLFVYLAGLESGLRPADRMIDRPIDIDGWRPRNNDGKYRGDISLTRALADSVNTVAVRIAERAGRDRVIAAAERLGITSKLTAHPSLALGTSGVSLLELTAAYGVFANRGYAVWPHGIIEVRDRAGAALYRRQGSGAAQVVAPEHVSRLTAMLREVVRTGTGRGARIEREAAGKTGTSQDFRDAWFIGFTDDLVAGVWLGNDDTRPMKQVTGGGLPAQLWRRFMSQAISGG